MDVHIPNGNHFVSERFERMARIIEDYDPNLELQWIPPENRTKEDGPPYQIWDYRGNYVVFRFNEQEALFPENILARLWAGDTTKHDVLSYLDSLEAAQKALALKEEMDLREEAKDKTAWLMGTKKNYINWRNNKGDKVKLDDQLRKLS